MSDFYKNFLLEDVRRIGGGSGRKIFLAAFGKHPGWDDHVEDLGLETESLIFAKTRLYVEGIGGQIDRGEWEKLDAQQQTPGFKHLFVWQRAGQFLIGRMWSSSDGKGRTRYPMIVCVHCAGVSLTWALQQVLPRIEKVEQECLLTKSASEVRFILTSARNALRNALNEVATELVPAPPPVTSEELAQFIGHPDLGPQQEGWFRLLYQMQSQMAAFAPGRFSLKGDLAGIRPQQMRIPPCGSAPAQTILLWSRFFQTQLDSAVPFLLALPLEEPWLDATVGEPTPHEFFSLRASPKAVPLVNEVPYNLDSAFREKAAATLAGFQNGQAPQDSDMASASASVSSGLSSTRQRFMKWFGGGAALIMVLVLLAIFLSGPRKETAQAAKAEQQPKAAHVTGPPVVAPSVQAEGQARENTRLAAETDAREKARLSAEADAKRLNEEKRLGEERAKTEAAARAAEEQEKVRLAADAESRRIAQEKAKAEAAAQEAARLKAQSEERSRTLLAANVQPQPLQPLREENSAPAPAGKQSNREMTNSIGMVLVQLPANYWVGKFEVTQAEYEKVMGANPSRSKIKNNPQLPVESVSWNEAMKFCQELTAKERAAGTLAADAIYTLPTQKQWNEFLGDARFEEAVTSDNGRRDGPAPVGSTASANAFGLFDVLGNVWEWCLDETETREKLYLGGAYNSLKTYPLKRHLAPDKPSFNLGFRCVLVPER